MRRRLFLSAMAATVAARGAALPEFRFRIRADRSGPSVPADFLGFGYEVSAAAVKDFFGAANRTYIQFLRTLAPQGVLRIGGNTVDYSTWSPDAAGVSAPRGTVVNRRSIEDLGAFLRAAGWRLIWTLNAGTGSPEAAADQAAAVASAAGEHLEAFEIGNEPDMFVFSGHRQPGYDYARYLEDFRRFAAAVRARVPNAPLAGPAVLAATDWTTSFAKDERAAIRLLTQHYYINDQSTPFATLDNLLKTDDRLAQITNRIRDVSASTGIPWRLAEANSFSGGGKPGVSDTFASALWALDLMFTLAGAGAAGINWETGVNHRGFVSSYSPIFQDQKGYSARPVYYAMLAFRGALGGKILAVDGNAAPWLKCWAFRDRAGRPWAAVINKNPASGAAVAIEAPGRSSSAEAFRLTAPAIDSTSGILFAGAAVSASGTWAARHTAPLRPRNRTIGIDMPPASAVLLRLS